MCFGLDLLGDFFAKTDYISLLLLTATHNNKEINSNPQETGNFLKEWINIDLQ